MKTLLTLVGLAALSLSGYSQGQFHFNNLGANGSPIAPVYGPEAANPHLQRWGNSADASPPGTQTYSGLRLDGTNYSVEGWYSLTPVLDPFALNEAGTAVPGTLTRFFPDSAAGFFAAFDPGLVSASDSVYLQVRAWDNAGGALASWADAWAAAQNGSGRAVGWSKVFLQPVTIGLGPPDGLHNFESFNIFIVPEPSTLTLLGVGSLSWLVLRRRRT